jgi:sodium-coupled neutral amino acid transporter 11
MHYNSPRFYTELKARSLPRFGMAVGSSFSIAAVMYGGIAAFGFLTFGGNSAGFILNNYSYNDPLATLARLMVGLSTLVAYPIVFMGVRDGVCDILEVPLENQTPQKLNQLTYILLAILTTTAVFVTDLGLINAVGGGLVSTAITFCFPAIMYQVAVTNMPGETIQVIVTSTLAVIGTILGLIGVYVAISGAISG